jgi:hypothetical protein
MGQTRKALMVVGAVALVAPIRAANGTSTICSNPTRAGIKAEATMPLQWTKVEELSRWLAGSSEKALGMSYSSVSSGLVNKPITARTIILQSPKVSVNIHVTARSGSRTAKVTVNRTCYNDALEPWLPYWKRFQKVMRSRGYALKTVQG